MTFLKVILIDGAKPDVFSLGVGLVPDGKFRAGSASEDEVGGGYGCFVGEIAVKPIQLTQKSCFKVFLT